MKFRYTILYVDDVPATLTFYEQAFGLQTGFLHDGGDYAELLTGDTRLAFAATGLLTQLGKSPQKPNPDGPVFELALETDDVAGAVSRATAAGAGLKQPPRQEPWGQTTAYVTDPNGFLIEICTPVSL